jgi:hypothetical protein
MTTTDTRRRAPGAPRHRHGSPAGIRPADPRSTDDEPRHAPVFVDRTGRRRKALVTAGIGGVAVVVSVLAGLLLATTGTPQHGLPGLPPGQTLGATPQAKAPRSPSTAATAGPTAPAAAATPPPATTPAPAAPAPSSASVSPTSHRHVPTQTPSHGRKK